MAAKQILSACFQKPRLVLDFNYTIAVRICRTLGGNLAVASLQPCDIAYDAPGNIMLVKVEAKGARVELYPNIV
eukprot:10911714-Alexandrium_andersonii.AAC.1